ncbi:MAG TPA: hypothetical protein PKE55_06095 [Kiritimatiellia bacterium]|nr:hypothetical protein [Kiritimatiellia bacterium]
MTRAPTHKLKHRARLSLPFLAIALSACSSFRVCDDRWTGRDKAYHFTASAAIGSGSYVLAREAFDTSRSEAALAASSVALAAGLAKETYDLHIKQTCWSWRDIAWDILGTSVGVTAAAWADRR